MPGANIGYWSGPGVVRREPEHPSPGAGSESRPYLAGPAGCASARRCRAAAPAGGRSPRRWPGGAACSRPRTHTPSSSRTSTGRSPRSADFEYLGISCGNT